MLSILNGRIHLEKTREDVIVIKVTRLNNSVVYVNADLIQTVEPTPDSIITLTNNIKMVVRETPDVIVERIIEYKRQILSNSTITVRGVD
jgi:flagellar protein FlbD